VAEPFLRLFHAFIDAYRQAARDGELLEVLPPFFAFRALVIAHPRWYPALADPTRAALIRFARRMLEPGPFAPEALPALFREAA
jgi:aminoglycoside phosphotransferase family enzyme